MSIGKQISDSALEKAAGGQISAQYAGVFDSKEGTSSGASIYTIRTDKINPETGEPYPEVIDPKPDDELPDPNPQRKNNSNVAIPIIAGIATAGAAATGAKIYFDRNKNEESEDEEESEYDTEEDYDNDYQNETNDDMYQSEEEYINNSEDASFGEVMPYKSKKIDEYENFN